MCIPAVMRRLGASRESSENVLQRPTTLLELFQNEDCSSNPDFGDFEVLNHDSNLASHLLLTYYVTSGDQLGSIKASNDTTFDRRQREYANRMSIEAPQAPQLVINGRASGIVASTSELSQVVADADAAQPTLLPVTVVWVVVKKRHILRVQTANVLPQSPLEVSVIHYDPKPVAKRIMHDENTGCILIHGNVVRAIYSIGKFTPGEVSLYKEIPKLPKDHKAVAMVQDGPGGPVLGFGRHDDRR